MAVAADSWSASDAYESYIGRWSRLVGREFLSWLAPEAGRRWVDVGCGTGALSGTVLAEAEPAALVGVDPAAGFVDHARAQVRDARAEFRVGDALTLPVPDATADYVVSDLVLNFAAATAAAVHPAGAARRVDPADRPGMGGGGSAAALRERPARRQAAAAKANLPECSESSWTRSTAYT